MVPRLDTGSLLRDVVQNVPRKHRTPSLATALSLMRLRAITSHEQRA